MTEETKGMPPNVFIVGVNFKLPWYAGGGGGQHAGKSEEGEAGSLDEDGSSIRLPKNEEENVQGSLCSGV